MKLLAAAAALLLILSSAGGVSSHDDLSTFVEEVGESEIISIDGGMEPELGLEAQWSGRIRREIREGEEGSGDDANDVDDDEDLSWKLSPTSVVVQLPASRSTPDNLTSPSFDDERATTRSIHPSRPLIAVSSSSPIEDVEEEEGSGNYDEEEHNSLVPTRVVDSAPAFSAFPYDLDSNEDVEEDHDDDVAVVNKKPYVQRRLQKYPVTAGKSVRIVIPDDTFFDPEDGTDLRLELSNDDGSSLRNTNWLRFDPHKRAVYALPVSENDIGRWKFVLTATDKEGETAQDTLEIVVRQYKRSRLINHQFRIQFSFADWDPASNRHWQWMMLDKIQRLYGDRKPTNIIVRTADENPYVFGWTNDTVTEQSCPKSRIKHLFGLLTDGEGGEKPSRALKALLERDEIFVESVTMSLHGTCLYDDDFEDHPKVSPKDESVPLMRNPIDRINVTAGELLRYKVPEDTCYDKEDGGTERLSLQLLTTDRKELSPDVWLQFDQNNQEFVGIPLEEEVGRSEYQLVCSDRSGLSVTDAIQVMVHNRPFSESFPVEFAFAFSATPGSLFRAGKVRIVESIANYFGDPTPSNVVLKTFDDDHNRLVWFNKSLAHAPCDLDSVRRTRDMLEAPDGKDVNPNLAAAFRRHHLDFKLTKVKVVERGSCRNADEVPTRRPADRERDGGTSFGGFLPSTDYLLTFVIPAVIVILMLILAILLACLLHRKRKAGKLDLFYSTESLPPRVPVILQDELYDDDNDPHRTNGHHGQVFKQPVMLPGDRGVPHEMEGLLQRQFAAPPLSLDPFSKGSLSRPTPPYQRRRT